MIHYLLILIFTTILIILPNLNKFKMSLLIESNFIKTIFIILFIFTVLENYLIGILMMIIFFYIMLNNNKEINESFIDNYKKKYI